MAELKFDGKVGADTKGGSLAVKGLTVPTLAAFDGSFIGTPANWKTTDDPLNVKNMSAIGVHVQRIVGDETAIELLPIFSSDGGTTWSWPVKFDSAGVASLDVLQFPNAVGVGDNATFILNCRDATHVAFLVRAIDGTPTGQVHIFVTPGAKA